MTVAPAPSDVYVANLDGADRDLLLTLLNKLADKSQRNRLRDRYYNGKMWLRDLGISLPPQLKNVETVVGWPAKAVDALAARVVFEGFVAAGEDDDPFGLDGVMAANRIDVEFPQAVTSALKQSVAFVSVLQGDTAAGEPEVLWQFHEATTATGIWDRRRRALSAALLLTGADDEGTPTSLALLLPDRVGVIERSGGRWRAVWRHNPLGEVPVEPLPYRPNLGRPFGRSRINRAVMSMTDEAVRTVLRTETSAEFHAAPQRYVLGADGFEDADGNAVPEWQSIIGRIWGITRDEDGQVPEVGQFPQHSMQPHTDHLRSIAARFSSETSLPLSSLGIVQDNPASAEAIFAAKEDLVIEAGATARSFSGGLVASGRRTVRLLTGTAPDGLSGLQAKWANPATPSVVSASDAVMKQVTAIPWLAESPVILEQLGYDRATITRLLADRRRAEGRFLLDQLAGLDVGTDGGDEG